ncbi:MAG: glycosyltransferase [Chloroflexi bacterium]|nr:glycosyltransferase [Chloroflexota bacterium]
MNIPLRRDAVSQSDLNILQISTYDHAGGAEAIAYGLFRAYRRRGFGSYMAVGVKRGNDAHVFEIPRSRKAERWRRFWLGVRRRAHAHDVLVRACLRMAALGEPQRWLERQFGVEDFNFPGTSRLLDLAPHPPDIFHAHNLHGGYFDLRALPRFSAWRPFFLTLHDAWLLSGHCVHSLDCDRWRIGCGRCPDLARPIAIKRDASAYNWRRKQRIFERSRLYVATPSQWLMDKVARSMLQSAVVEARVIHNGVDLTLFHPGDKLEARQALGLPRHSLLVLFVGRVARRSPWKDYVTMEQVVKRLASQWEADPITFLFLGESGEAQRMGSATVLLKGFQSDPHQVAAYYRAADVYIHAARADTFPNAVIEAMACGLPVVATAVGGIPEQVQDGRTGFLVPAGDAEAMAVRLFQLLKDEPLRQRMGAEAALVARERFDRERMVDDYLHWYHEVLAHRLDDDAGG